MDKSMDNLSGNQKVTSFYLKKIVVTGNANKTESGREEISTNNVENNVNSTLCNQKNASVNHKKIDVPQNANETDGDGDKMSPVNMKNSIDTQACSQKNNSFDLKSVFVSQNMKDTGSDREEISSYIEKNSMDNPSGKEKTAFFTHKMLNTGLKLDSGGLKSTPLAVCRCKRRCFKKFSESRTREVYESFRKIDDSTKQKKWMLEHVLKADMKQSKRKRKIETRNYFLTNERGRRLKVCAGYFQRVLGFPDGSFIEPLMSHIDHHHPKDSVQNFDRVAAQQKHCIPSSFSAGNIDHHHLAHLLQTAAYITANQKDPPASLKTYPCIIDRDVNGECSHRGHSQIEQSFCSFSGNIHRHDLADPLQKKNSFMAAHQKDSLNTFPGHIDAEVGGRYSKRGQHQDGSDREIDISRSGNRSQNLDISQYKNGVDSSHRSWENDVAKDKIRKPLGGDTICIKKDRTEGSITICCVSKKDKNKDKTGRSLRLNYSKERNQRKSTSTDRTVRDRQISGLSNKTETDNSLRFDADIENSGKAKSSQRKNTNTDRTVRDRQISSSSCRTKTDYSLRFDADISEEEISNSGSKKTTKDSLPEKIRRSARTTRMKGSMAEKKLLNIAAEASDTLDSESARENLIQAEQKDLISSKVKLLLHADPKIQANQSLDESEMLQRPPIIIRIKDNKNVHRDKPEINELLPQLTLPAVRSRHHHRNKDGSSTDKKHNACRQMIRKKTRHENYTVNLRNNYNKGTIKSKHSSNKLLNLRALKKKHEHPMLPACHCSRRRCIENIPEERRRTIHHQFWDLTSYKDRRKWLVKFVEKRERKNKVLSLFPQRKNESKRYFLPDEKNEVVEVCRLFFIHTLGFRWDSVVDAAVRDIISSGEVGYSSHQLIKLPRQLPDYVVDSVTEYLISVRRSCTVTKKASVDGEVRKMFDVGQNNEGSHQIASCDNQNQDLSRLKIKDLFKNWKINHKNLKFNLGYQSFRRIFQSVIDPIPIGQVEVKKINQNMNTNDVDSAACSDGCSLPLEVSCNQPGNTDHQNTAAESFSEEESEEIKSGTNLKGLAHTESVLDSDLTCCTRKESVNLIVNSKTVCHDDKCIDLKNGSELQENLANDNENYILDFGTGFFKQADTDTIKTDNSYSDKTQYKKRQSLSTRNDRSNYPVLPPCKCRKRKCVDKFTESQRQEINTMFWDLGSYNQRKQWILEHIKRADIKRRIVISEGTPRKLESRWYCLPGAGGSKVDVCKGFFLRTLGYRWDSVIDTIGKTTPKGVQQASLDKRGKKPPPHKISDEAVASMELYIKNICNTYQHVDHKGNQDHTKGFNPNPRGQIPFGLTMKQLFEDYKCKHANHKFGYESFRKVFWRVCGENGALQPPNVDSNDKPEKLQPKMTVLDDKSYSVNKDYPVGKDCLVERSYPIDKDLVTKDYPIGKDCLVERSYPIDKDLVTKDYPVGKDCLVDKSYPIDKDLVTKDYPVGKDCLVEKSYPIDKDLVTKDYPVGKDCFVKEDYLVDKDLVRKDCSAENYYLIDTDCSLRNDYTVSKDYLVQENYSAGKEARKQECCKSIRSENSRFGLTTVSFSETNLQTSQPTPAPLPPSQATPSIHSPATHQHQIGSHALEHSSCLYQAHNLSSDSQHHLPVMQVPNGAEALASHQYNSTVTDPSLVHHHNLYCPPTGVFGHLTPGVSSHFTPDVSSHLTPGVSSHLTPDVSSHLTPSVSSHLTPGMSSHLTPIFSGHLTRSMPGQLTTVLSGHSTHLADHVGHSNGVNPHTNIESATCRAQGQSPPYFVPKPGPLQYHVASQYQSILHHIRGSSRFFSYAHPPDNTFHEPHENRTFATKQDFQRNNTNSYNNPNTVYDYLSEPASTGVQNPARIHPVHFNVEQESTATVSSPYWDENDGFVQDHKEVCSAANVQGSSIPNFNHSPYAKESKESTSKDHTLTKKGKNEKKKVEKEIKMKPKSLRNYREHYPMLVTCNCKKKKCNEKFSEAARQTLHDNFWDLTDYNERKQWMLQHIKREDCKRRRVDQFESFRKLESRWYFFPDKDGNQQEVCKDFFLRTLGYKWDSVIDTIRRTTPKGETTTRPDQRGRKAPAHKLSGAVLRSVVQYIKSMQQVSQPLNEYDKNAEDSNYEESNENAVGKNCGEMTVPYGLTMKDLYDDYKAKHVGHKIGYESFRRIYRDLSKSENIVFNHRTSENEFLNLNNEDGLDF